MEKLHASLVIEILGRPKEHVTEALNSIVDRMASEKGVSVRGKKVHDPRPVEDSDGLFTSFVEVEVDFDSIENYLGILFAYLPSNIEVVSPTKITISSSDLNDLGNKLVQRIHQYDAVTRNALVEKDAIFEKLKEVAPEVVEQQIQKNKEEQAKK